MEKIRHVYGNVMKIAIPLTIRIRTLSNGVETETESDFYPNMDYPTKVILVGVGFIRYEYDALIEGNVALIKAGTDVRVGTYHIEVLAHDENAEPVRFKERSVIEIVDATADAGIKAGVEFNAETYTLDGAVFFYAKGDKGDKGDAGVGISDVRQIETSHISGGINVIGVFLTDGTMKQFYIRNGEKPSFAVVNETLRFY